MKKISFCLLLFICLFITGCGEEEVKVATTIDKFVEVSQNNNLLIVDNSDAYDVVDYIVDSRKAVVDDTEIEMVVYIDSEHADKALEHHIDSFETLKSTAAAEKEKKGNNYHSYFLISNNRYMISTRIDNTLIFSKSMLEDKELVEKIISELGY